MRVRVKICGITGVDDAWMAVEAGADAIGLVLAESPRQVNLETASDIVRSLPPLVEPVGVFVDESTDHVAANCRRAGIGVIQLCGAESAKDVAALQKKGFRVVKAIHITPDGTPDEKDDLGADAVLFDTRIPGFNGGTGVTFDPSLVERLRFNVPVILAGGLTPENVVERVQQIRPYAVDVSSGVESSPGKKDGGLVQRFIQAVKASESS